MYFANFTDETRCIQQADFSRVGVVGGLPLRFASQRSCLVSDLLLAKQHWNYVNRAHATCLSF